MCESGSFSITSHYNSYKLCTSQWFAPGGLSDKPAEFEIFDTISLIYITVKSRGFSRYPSPLQPGANH